MLDFHLCYLDANQLDITVVLEHIQIYAMWMRVLAYLPGTVDH